MSLKLKGINFGNVFNVSGARNFFGPNKVGGDWRQHRPLKLIHGYSWEGSAFISKTTPLKPRIGNMDLRQDLQPVEFFPSCIYIDYFKAIALNNVSLSSPGAEALLSYGFWQKMTEPFFISFMAIAETPEARLEETMAFCVLLKRNLAGFKAKFGLEINISCPNAGHKPEALIKEAVSTLKVVKSILPDTPLVLKINALTNPRDVKRITEQGYCDALAISNTIPWLQNAAWTKRPSMQIDWLKLFGDTISPLKLRGFGNGGLSGWPLLNLVVEWVMVARQINITLPIKAEGGIQKKEDIRRLVIAGANAIGLGSVSFLRPHRLGGLIKYGNSILGEDKRRQNTFSMCGFSKALQQN